MVLRLHCVVEGLLRSPLFLLDVAHCLPHDSGILDEEVMVMVFALEEAANLRP